MVEPSSAVRPGPHPFRRAAGGTPVVGFPRRPGTPAVSTVRFGPTEYPVNPDVCGRPHAHDFLVLTYLESGSGTLSVNGTEWPVSDGDALVVAPGAVVDEPDGPHAVGSGWCVFFPPDTVTGTGAGRAGSWRSHPLLFPFTAGAAGIRRLHVPPADRPAWSDRIAALDTELRQRRDGYAEAALAHLALLLVGVTRLAADVPDGLRRNGEPLLATVFATIESRFAEPLSLRDVAAEVGLTPGHLTTTVARRTGRTVQQWITERRMTEARRLLTDTDLTVSALSTRAGYRDVSYFVRTFRREHGVTPTDWRAAARGWS